MTLLKPLTSDRERLYAELGDVLIQIGKLRPLLDLLVLPARVEVLTELARLETRRKEIREQLTHH